MGDNLLYKLCQTRQRAHHALNAIDLAMFRGFQPLTLDLRCKSSLQYLERLDADVSTHCSMAAMSAA